jgi:hypothetical protein
LDERKNTDENRAKQQEIDDRWMRSGVAPVRCFTGLCAPPGKRFTHREKSKRLYIAKQDKTDMKMKNWDMDMLRKMKPLEKV